MKNITVKIRFKFNKNNNFNRLSLAEESFKYVYDNLKKDVHLASIAGGTDLVGCLVLGSYSNVSWEKFKVRA